MRISTLLRTVLCVSLFCCMTMAQAKDFTVTYEPNVMAVYAVNTTEGIAKLKDFFDGTKKVKKFEVPRTITYKSGSKTYKLTVTKIGENAFGGAECSTVILPNTIEEIGDLAFCGVKNVNVPSKVKIIGEQAYKGVTFESVKIPATCSRIDHFAFTETKIGSLTIAGGDTPLSIGQGAFMESNVAAVIIPARLKMIENRAFANCPKLQYITFEGPVSVIPFQCFTNCSALKYVSMVNGTSEIENHAFAGCSSLGDFPWSASLRTIGWNAFADCGLLSANFFEGLQTIGDGAFRGNAQLKTISFPSTLRAIGNECFYGCEALEEVNSYAAVPPQVDTPSFPLCAPVVPIIVPVNSVAAYKAADGWKRFDYRYYASSIGEVESDSAPADAGVQWYDLQGHPVDADRPGTGVYIRVSGSTVEKVVLK